MSTPYIFDDFFASGLEESVSPFLTKNSKKWGESLLLKSAFLSLFFFAFSLIFAFHNLLLSRICITFVFFLSGTPAVLSAIEDLKNLQININMMMTIAAFVALLLGSYLEGGLLLVLFAFSSALEEKVIYKTKEALHHLHKMVPKIAFVIESSGKIVEKNVRDVRVGDSILIKEGEMVPLDGKIVSGTASLNLAHLTGEHIPVSKTVGDEIPSGSKNLEGILTIEVIRSSSDSTLMKLIDLITQAGESKPKVQNWLDRIGKYYAIFVILFTLLFALLSPLLFSYPYLGENGSIYRSLCFFIAASPCALILAIPTAYFSALSSSAKKGIIVKGGNIFDGLASCNYFAFDKTGTLTTGNLSCENIVSLQENGTINISEALQIAAALEKHSHHPIARAVGKKFQKENMIELPLLSFASTAGCGVTGIIHFRKKDRKAFIGNLLYILPNISKENQKLLPSQLEKYTEGKSYTLLLVENELFLFFFSDPIRKEGKQVIEALQKKGKKTVLLTGDREQSAQEVGQLLGINEVFFNLKPKEKLSHIGRMAKDSHLAMVGDGINDAPALSRATVGISMGKGASQVAIDASDAVILREDLSLVKWLFDKACMTKRVIVQNLFCALSLMLVATISALLGDLPLWLAVIVHEGGTLLVSLNSLRLLSEKNH